ncbi:hypothetical protein [Holophaga foetida]|uniref:hypothetical protein n=1 Tax=Holophaga foetida TaxID=35839 RepID=UPI0002473758|nr:hypothetical protein [Holophaga foetida]
MNLKPAAFALLLLALPAMARPCEGDRWEHSRGHVHEQRDDRDYRPRRMAPLWSRGHYRPRYEREQELLVVHPEARFAAPRDRPRISLWIGF